MGEIYSVASVIAYIFSAAFLVAGGVLFVALDVRAVYGELYGDKTKKHPERRKTERKIPREKSASFQGGAERAVEDEPPTVAENGEEVLDSLVGVYDEYGDGATELMTEATEPETEEAVTEKNGRDGRTQENPDLREELSGGTFAAGKTVEAGKLKFKVVRSIILADPSNVLDSINN